MKTLKLLITIIFFAHAITTPANAGGKNQKNIKQKGGSQCVEMAKTLQKTRSASQLKSVLRNYGMSKVKSCQQYLKSDKKLEQTLRNLAATEKSAQKRKHQNYAQKNLRKVTPYKKLKANQPIVKLKTISARKVRSLKKSTTSTRAGNRNESSTTGNQNTVPRISEVTPNTIAPGLDVIIDGIGFGDSTGTVKVKISGKTFNAVINAWQDGWINIYLPESISGVHETNNAVIVVKMNNKTLNFNIPFIPISEQRVVNGWFAEGLLADLFVFTGHSGEKTFFPNTVLKNGWTVKEWYFDEFTSTNECPEQTPFVSSGGNRLDSRIKWSHAWLAESIFCGIDVVIEGHKGFDAGVEEFVRSF